MRPKFLILFLMLIFATQAISSCREDLEHESERLQSEFKESLKENAYVGLSVGALLFIISPPVSAGLVGIMGAGLSFQAKEIRSLKKLIKVIDQSYTYQETSEPGKVLHQLAHKHHLSEDQLVALTIKLNENGELCSLKRKNVKQMMKLILKHRSIS